MNACPKDWPIIGKSLAIDEVRKKIEKIAKTDAAVLIFGESGTGKKLFAHAIHEQSERRIEPFVVVNCAAIPETLIENEFFGHERGAFTGAATQKIGKFEAAGNGTIFLDEIGDLSLSAQAKILHILEGEPFCRVGGLTPIHPTARIIAATNKDLKEEIKRKRFRLDLYFRLNVIYVTIPPLKERRGDISLLANHLVDEHNSAQGVQSSISADALKLLTSYDWPGNVRELENMIRRALVFNDGRELKIEDFPLDGKVGTVSPKIDTVDFKKRADGFIIPEIDDSDNFLEEIEREAILLILRKTDGNQKQAAKILGIAVKTLYNKMKRHGIERGQNV